jgi:hypothetical protein
VLADVGKAPGTTAWYRGTLSVPPHVLLMAPLPSSPARRARPSEEGASSGPVGYCPVAVVVSSGGVSNTITAPCATPPMVAEEMANRTAWVGERRRRSKSWLLDRRSFRRWNRRRCRSRSGKTPRERDQSTKLFTLRFRARINEDAPEVELELV